MQDYVKFPWLNFSRFWYSRDHSGKWMHAKKNLIYGIFWASFITSWALNINYKFYYFRPKLHKILWILCCICSMKNPCFKKTTYLFVFFSFQDRDIDLPSSVFLIIMKTKRWITVKRFLNGRWTHGERKVKALEANSERKSEYNERTEIKAHAERRVHGR